MLVCACLLAHPDLLSKSWAGGHWLWITKGYLFNNILLLGLLLLTLQLLLPVWLGLSSSSQSAVSHFSLLLPLLSQQPLPQAFQPGGFALCRGSKAWVQPPASSNGRLQPGGRAQAGSEAGIVLELLSSRESVAIQNTSVAEEVLYWRTWCYSS